MERYLCVGCGTLINEEDDGLCDQCLEDDFSDDYDFSGEVILEDDEESFPLYIRGTRLA